MNRFKSSLAIEHSKAFSQRLLQIIQAHPQGISEFELLRALEADGDERFGADKLKTNLSLFQSHFFLFHHLYLLRKHLFDLGQAVIDISPLRIQLLPMSDAAQQQIGQHDPLQDYYLDLSNLANTGDAEIESILHQFWQKLLRNDRRAQALAELGLQDPVSWDTIKGQHRRLVMQHHPDRGGDVQRIQIINAALEILKTDKK